MTLREALKVTFDNKKTVKFKKYLKLGEIEITQKII